MITSEPWNERIQWMAEGDGHGRMVRAPSFKGETQWTGRDAFWQPSHPFYAGTIVIRNHPGYRSVAGGKYTVASVDHEGVVKPLMSFDTLAPVRDYLQDFWNLNHE